MIHESELADSLQERKLALQRRREYFLEVLAAYADDIAKLDDQIAVVESQQLEIDLARRLDR
ncbi:MAG: hypothetical protein HPY61_01635 [Methanotrichaceae archaeon]|nr:hypothetical protein [Methanotrichaceae archaeon]